MLSTLAPLLELRGIRKRFGATLDNDVIDFELRGGRDAAARREPAGRSTLMSIPYGLE